MSERTPITHVAIRFQGRVFSLPSPNRHHDIIRLIVEETGVKSVDTDEDDEGFLDASGRYLNRKQALVSAKLHGQIKDESKVRARMLTSEDVW
jgi:hypothetical protein